MASGEVDRRRKHWALSAAACVSTAAGKHGVEQRVSRNLSGHVGVPVVPDWS